VPLPEEAVGLSFGQEEDQARYIQGEGELRDTTPVPPGQETMLVFVSYHLPITGTVHVERSYDHPLALLNILLAQPGLTLESDQMQAQGMETFQGRQYALYGTANLAAGSPLAFDLLPVETDVSGTATQPGTSGPGVTDQQGLVGRLGLVLAAAALGGVIGYAIAARPGRAPAPEALESDPRARPLLAGVADLDAAFEAGEVDEETYRRERAARLDAIRAL
jgi:hypothetical protein